MERAGMSQAELARRTGVQQATISRVLRGADGRRRSFTPEQAKRLWPVVKRMGVRREHLLLPPGAKL